MKYSNISGRLWWTTYLGWYGKLCAGWRRKFRCKRVSIRHIESTLFVIMMIQIKGAVEVFPMDSLVSQIYTIGLLKTLGSRAIDFDEKYFL